MKPLPKGASRAAGPGGSRRMWTWLIAVALAFGVAPRLAWAQGVAAPTGQGQGQGQSQDSTPRLQMPRLAGAALFGLPTKDGRVQWPFGLESLTPSDESQALRDQLELVLDLVAAQAADGQVNRGLTDFGLGAVRDLRKLVNKEKGGMHPKTYAEATRFLDRAERGLTLMKTLETGPGPTRVKTVETRPAGPRP